MATVTTSNIAAFLVPGLAEVWGNAYNRHKEQWKDLVTIKDSNRAWEEMQQMNGLGLAGIKEQGASVNYDSRSQGGKARATHAVYSNGLIITKEAISDNLYMEEIGDGMLDLKISMVETKENVVANFYNRAFDSNYTGGGDSVCLLSASHTTSSGNQSNILSTAADLSEASLEDLIIQIKKAKNDRGFKVQLMPETLLIPPELEFEAARILKSINQSETANNAINAIRASNSIPGGFTVNNYFTDPDAFFIKTNATKGLTLFQRWPLKVEQDNDFGTSDMRIKASERYSITWGEWREVYGSAGA